MKIAIVFILCVIAVHAYVSEKMQEKIAEECLKETNLFEYKNKDGSQPTVEQMGCHLACMNKKLGFMRQDGTYDEDFILSQENTSESRSKAKIALDEAMKDCQIEAGNNICKLAYCVHWHPRIIKT